jgi:type VI secretion system secreted protein Hcp
LIKTTILKAVQPSRRLAEKRAVFALQSVSWSGARGVNIEIGNAENRDSGIVHMGELSCSKSYDGASPFMSTFLFYPGTEGKTVFVTDTKPNREGDGIIPYLEFELTNARMSNYSIMTSDGGDPSESFSLVYTKVTITYYVEDDGGKVTKAATVAYDAPTAKLESKADLK